MADPEPHPMDREFTCPRCGNWEGVSFTVSMNPLDLATYTCPICNHEWLEGNPTGE